jgi:F-type H+-transporting ATPase subunit epsilon
MPLHLEIVTPERRAFVGDVDEVVVPGSEGELGILPHHAPLISTLGQGVLRIKRGAEVEEFAIFGGFLQVRPDRVVVLAEMADLAAEIDLERAERARREAEQMLESGFVEPSDLAAARAALQRALIRIRLAERGPRGTARGEHEAARRRSAPSNRSEPPGE